MGIITVNITVNNIGSDTGPFDIYDDYTGLLATNLSKEDLISGFTIDIDDAASQIRVCSMGICNNILLVPITTFPLSPTPSPTPSISVTRTPSITPSISLTPTRTPSTTPSISVSPSIIITRTPSVTPSITNSPTVTPSISISSTPSITPSISVSVTPSISISSTPSVTPSISISPTQSPSSTPGASISISRTPSITPSVTRTPTVTPSPSAFPTLFLGLTTAGVNDACTNGELPGYTWILGSRSDTSLCDTSFIRNTSSSILSTIGIGNFFWLRQGTSTRKFQVALFSFGEFAGELYGMAVESCAVCPSVTPTPSISISRTPTQTPSLTPSPTPPCCNYYDLGISGIDTAGAINNTLYENNVVYVRYVSCNDVSESIAFSAGIYDDIICVKPGNTPSLIIYQENNPAIVSYSSASIQECCSSYPPPSPTPTPSISITRTPTPSVSVGTSTSPTPTLTPTPSVTPAAPTAFTYSDTVTFTGNFDCGDGNFGFYVQQEVLITLVDNCVDLNPRSATTTYNFEISIGGDCNYVINRTINPTEIQTSANYYSQDGCSGTFCSANLTSYPGTLTLC